MAWISAALQLPRDAGFPRSGGARVQLPNVIRARIQGGIGWQFAADVPIPALAATIPGGVPAIVDDPVQALDLDHHYYIVYVRSSAPTVLRACRVETWQATYQARDCIGVAYVTEHYDVRLPLLQVCNACAPDIGTTGKVTLIAGTGVQGFSGDGGDPKLAKLDTPIGLAWGTATTGTRIGCNGSLREIDTHGNIQTIAGTGTPGYNSAQTTNPLEIISQVMAIAPTNPNYFAELGNAVTGRTAGSPTMEINPPVQYSIHILSGGSQLVLKESGAGGTINLYADPPWNGGVAAFPLAFVTGLLLAPNGDLYTTLSYFAQHPSPFPNPTTSAKVYGYRILKLPSGGTTPVIVAEDTFSLSDADPPGGSYLSSLHVPFGLQIGTLGQMAMDSAGNLYAPVSPSGRAFPTDPFPYAYIYKLSSSGVGSAYAGTGAVGYSGDGGDKSLATFTKPAGIAVDSHGTLYVADAGAHVIRRIDGATGVITTICGTGVAGSIIGANGVTTQLNAPRGVAVDSACTMLIADTGNQRVLRLGC